MQSKIICNHENFLKNKEKISAMLEKAILITLEELGEDIRGISWFSSLANEHSKNTNQISK